jgi:FAD/FMN-containing dehydrogenase
MQVKTQADELQNYLTDASNMPGGFADKLFIPENREEIAEILKEASAHRIPVTISGARTGTVGGAIPFGGFVISLEKLNKIEEIDKTELSAVVQSGVILNDFQKAVERENLFYPPPTRPNGAAKSAARSRRTLRARGVSNTARRASLSRSWKSFWQTAKS